MNEYIKVYPTRGITDRSPAAYAAAFRDRLLADEDITAKFTISDTDPDYPNEPGFILIPKFVDTDTYVKFIFSASYVGIMRVKSNGTILGGNWESYQNILQNDFSLELIKGEGLIGIYLRNSGRYRGALFADMINTDDNTSMTVMFIDNSDADVALRIGTDTTYSRMTSLRAIEKRNTIDTYVVYPLMIFNGYTHKSLYIYDGGGTDLSYGKWSIGGYDVAVTCGSGSGRWLIALDDIPTGEPAALGTKEITENGEYNASDDNFDGYSKIKVKVPTVDYSDIISEPTLGRKDITANGTYYAADDSMDGYNMVNVNIELTDPDGLRPAELTVKTITENGNYTAADDGKDGFSEVTVNVPERYKVWTRTLTDIDIKITARSAKTDWKYAVPIIPRTFFNIPDSQWLPDRVQDYYLEVIPFGADEYKGVTVPYVSVDKMAAGIFCVYFMSPKTIKAGTWGCTFRLIVDLEAII